MRKRQPQHHRTLKNTSNVGVGPNTGNGRGSRAGTDPVTGSGSMIGPNLLTGPGPVTFSDLATGADSVTASLPSTNSDSPTRPASGSGSAPGWYARLQHGPFSEEGFTPEMMAVVEQAAAGYARHAFRDRRRAAVSWLGGLIAAAALAGVVWLSVDDQTTVPSHPGRSAQVAEGTGPSSGKPPQKGNGAAELGKEENSSTPPGEEQRTAGNAKNSGLTRIPQTTGNSKLSEAPGPTGAPQSSDVPQTFGEAVGEYGAPIATDSPSPAFGAQTKGQESTKEHNAPPVPAFGWAVFELGGMPYHIPLREEDDILYVHAGKTDFGVLWAPAVKRNGDGLEMHPIEPYSLVLSGTGSRELSEDTALPIYTFPLTVWNERAGNEAYLYVDGIYGAGPYAVISTSSRLNGAPQASEEQLWAFDVQAAAAGKILKPQMIVSYHSVGGALFEFGVNRERMEVVYVSSVPDGDGGYQKTAGLYSLSTGAAGKLTAYRMDSGVIHYVRNGTSYTAVLQTPSLPQLLTSSKAVSKQ